MPYVQSNVVLQRGIANGRRWWLFTWSETGVTTTSEWSINANTAKNTDGSDAQDQPAIPKVGTITLLKALGGGAGVTTIQPKLGRAPNPTAGTQDYIGQYTPAALSFNDATPLRFSIKDLGSPTIYGRTTPDAGADGTSFYELTIVEGHI